VWPEWALGERALAAGRIEDAARHLGRAAAVHDAAGLLEPGSRPWQPSLIEALVRLGESGRAEDLLGAWADAARATGRRFALATAARCRGLLCDEASVDEVFAGALALHAEPAMPFERARTLLCHGERLRRARRRADARAPLREALGIFDRLGAGDWAARTRQELRATGGTVPSGARPGAADLTPHELQVALMVAEGRTNREVAAAMFLAPKTIEHHLSAIFRKLGLRRRTELARLFAGDLRLRAGGAEPVPQ
jgi:DNA-binding CsgD family transcriptional regulator